MFATYLRSPFLALLGLSLAFPTLRAQSDFDWSSIPPSSKLQWTACYGGFECTRLEVPLDYASPAAASTAAIAITRLRATSAQSEYRGPILVNPGGPSGSGVEWVLEIGANLATIVGPEFDIVGFDPRGTSFSTPLVSWFLTDAERALWIPPSANTLYESVNQTGDALAVTWARAQVQAQLAVQRDHNYMQYITTDYTARDMLSITKAFGFQKLQYWGISYGSILGATYAAMFPDNIGRVVIDGVLPLNEWYSANLTGTLADADRALQIFIDGCHTAGPSACAFYASTPALISANLENLLAAVQTAPVPVVLPDGASYGIVDYTFLKNFIYDALYQPYALFAPLAQALADLAAGDGSTLYSAVVAGVAPFTCPAGNKTVAPLAHDFEAGVTITCGDAVAVNDTIAQLQEFYADQLTVSSYFADLRANWRILCTGWKIHREGRFAGPFGAANTSFPLLIIGNTADHVTPIAGANATAQAFPGSVLLTLNTPGHTSTAANSTCINEHMRAYFRNGTLPEEGTVCQPEGTLFPATGTVASRSRAVNRRSWSRFSL